MLTLLPTARYFELLISSTERWTRPGVATIAPGTITPASKLWIDFSYEPIHYVLNAIARYEAKPLEMGDAVGNLNSDSPKDSPTPKTIIEPSPPIAPPAPDEKTPHRPDIEEFEIEVDSIPIAVSYNPTWSRHSDTVHFEFRSLDEPARPIPCSESGYHSHFSTTQSVEEYGSPQAYATAYVERHRTQGLKRKSDKGSSETEEQMTLTLEVTPQASSEGGIEEGNRQEAKESSEYARSAGYANGVENSEGRMRNAELRKARGNRQEARVGKESSELRIQNSEFRIPNSKLPPSSSPPEPTLSRRLCPLRIGEVVEISESLNPKHAARNAIGKRGKILKLNRDFERATVELIDSGERHTLSTADLERVKLPEITYLNAAQTVGCATIEGKLKGWLGFKTKALYQEWCCRSRSHSARLKGIGEPKRSTHLLKYKWECEVQKPTIEKLKALAERDLTQPYPAAYSNQKLPDAPPEIRPLVPYGTLVEVTTDENGLAGFKGRVGTAVFDYLKHGVMDGIVAKFDQKTQQYLLGSEFRVVDTEPQPKNAPLVDNSPLLLAA